jgi:diguanylate cyclase (GGDEF)-like protein
VHTYHTSEVDLLDGRWVLVAQQLYRSGNIVSVCTDITRSKEAELALHVAYAELERLAMTDELTGVPNRRHFLAQLENELQRALRYKHQASLVMLDLDHFKQVNDRYGHPAGDEVLKHFAELLRGQIRREDVVGRLGGEEFALLMPETAQSGAQTVLERIRHELAQARLDFIAPGFGYTFSAGVAELPVTEPPACNHWIHAADQALYRAKAGGRNRTALYRAE